MRSATAAALEDEAVKLTQRRIETLECPAGAKDALVFDDEQRGLGVRVTTGGGKSYVAQYTFAGAKRRVPLGSCSAISLAAAREAVRAILGDAARGVDTAAERKARLKAAADGLTLADLIDQWDKLHLSAKRANYSTAATSSLRRLFAYHLDKPAVAVDRSAVVRVLDRLSKDDRTAMAAATARYGSALYGWAIRRGTLSANPFQKVPVSPTVRRERVLSDDEIRRVWIATEEPGAFNGIVRTLLLTGQRREEVAGMIWNEIVPDFSAWTVPASRAKNGVAHVVPLSPLAQTILRAAPRFAKESDERAADDDKSDLVFHGEQGVFCGWSKSKGRLDQRSGIAGWTLHDLRRTMATGLQRLGVRLEVTEAVLNHVSGSRAGIIGVYQRHTWSDEKRAALIAWGAHVAAIVEGRESGGNVTPLRRTS
jgi:integrase